MLVIFPDNIEPLVNELCSSGPVAKLRGLTKVLDSHGDGHHVIVVPPDICRIIEKCTRLSEEQRGIAKKIRNRFSELSELQSILPIYGEVCTDEDAPTLQAGVWKIPLAWIAQHGLSKTHLICEDLYDCQMSHEAARDFLNNTKNLQQLKLALDHTAGGGGNTHRVFEEEAIIASKVSLCVVDSDRAHPGITAALGATATKCMSVSGSGLYELVISDGREFENHLPFRLLDKLRATWHGKCPSTTLSEFCALHTDFWLFADLKVGLRRREAEKMTGDCNTYWVSCANIFPHSRVKCCPTRCSVIKNDETCKQVVFEPLGKALLREAIAYLRDDARIMSTKRSADYLPSPNDVFWTSLGSKVAAYGISVKVNSSM